MPERVTASDSVNNNQADLDANIGLVGNGFSYTGFLMKQFQQKNGHDEKCHQIKVQTNLNTRLGVEKTDQTVHGIKRHQTQQRME